MVTQWHIKNYQPTVYEEIQKIMKKKKKLVKRKRKRTRPEDQEQAEIAEIADRYYTIATQEDFSGPIEQVLSPLQGHLEVGRLENAFEKALK